MRRGRKHEELSIYRVMQRFRRDGQYSCLRLVAWEPAIQMEPLEPRGGELGNSLTIKKSRRVASVAQVREVYAKGSERKVSAGRQGFHTLVYDLYRLHEPRDVEYP